MGLTDLIGLGGKLIDKLIPDPAAKSAAQLELLKLAQTGELAQLQAETDLAKGQIEVNNTEAASSSVFIGGWRPAVGWVCAGGLFYQFLASPLITGLSSLFGKVVTMPSLEMESLLTLLFGMLGLSVSRSYEKVKGVTK